MDWLVNLFSTMQQWLFETAVLPVLFALGMGNLLEDGYEATAWFMVGLLQIMVMLAVIAPLQRWRPVEPVTDRATIRTDVVYTLIHRLGVFRVVLFFTLEPWFDEVFGSLRTAGYGTFHLDQLWPGVTVLSTPGHSPGHLSLIVELPSTGAVLITADAISRPSQLVDGFTDAWDAAQARREAARIIAIARQRRAFVIFGHDPAQWPTLRKAPSFYD